MSAITTPDGGIKGQTVVSVPDAIALLSNNANNNVKLVDGSWYLKGRNGRDEFQEGPRIAGANFFDIDDISTPSHLPHMMPPKQLFAAAMDAMGITNKDHIIVYGAKDCVSIPKTKNILRHDMFPAIYTYQKTIRDVSNYLCCSHLLLTIDVCPSSVVPNSQHGAR
jgi:hypothetical protein